MLGVLLGLAIWWVVESLIGGLLYLAGGRMKSASEEDESSSFAPK